MSLTPKFLALGLAALTLAPAATAGDWGLRFGKRTKHGQVSVQVGSRGYQVDLTHRRRAQGHYHSSSCRNVPGHYEVVRERDWVPGCREKVWVPARIEVFYDDCGRRIERVTVPAHWDWVETPGRWEWREHRVWVPARYECGSGCGISSSRGHGSGHGRGGITPYPRYRRR